MPRITAIELENFQTIGKRSVIPIRDLTLMFGPNGAGKSAIFDALEMLKLILSDDWGEDCSKLESLLNKWSRNIYTDNPSNSLGLGIQIYIDKNWGTDDLPYEIFQRLDRIYHSSLASDGDYSDELLEKNIRFFIKFEDVGESINSWFISELSISAEDNPILELKQDEPGKYPLAKLYEKEWISFSTFKKIIGEHKNIKLENGILSGRVPNTISFECSARAWFDKGYAGDRAIEEEFFNLYQQVIDFFKIVITAELKDTPLVKASRTVPSVRETISIIPGKKYYGDDRDIGYRLEWSPMLKTLRPIININEEFWVQMSNAVADAMASGGDQLETEWFDLSILGRINSLLREELFIENGYQLTGEVRCIASIKDISEFDFSDADYYPKLVRLHLIDNYQRNLEIEDVGSGIGYVLPVLASLVQDDISLIQQPELHLHPRLQSMLGEAVVRAVENKKYFRAFTIIETHSEHLLLRVMRLIRNSESRKSDSLNPITYDRVSVLYFDPMPNGETQVKRLRLAPDGQLIDRWPGGFFNERFNDIFDE